MQKMKECMNKMKKISFIILSFTFSIFFSPSLYAGLGDFFPAILSNEEDVLPERKKARTKLATSMVTHLLNHIESNNVTTTKCQRPTHPRPQSVSTKLDSSSFKEPVPEPQCTQSSAGPNHHPFFEDTRAKVPQPENWPHSVYGAVFWEYPDGRKVWKGTGTLIGPKLVLTCAHVLWHVNQDIKAYEAIKKDRSITFIPSMREDDKRSEEHKSELQ